MITLIIILAIIYIIGIILWWNAVRLLFTYKWKRTTPDTQEIIIMFIPIVNLMFGIIGTIDACIAKGDKDQSNFFNIKK